MLITRPVIVTLIKLQIRTNVSTIPILAKNVPMNIPKQIKQARSILLFNMSPPPLKNQINDSSKYTTKSYALIQSLILSASALYPVTDLLIKNYCIDIVLKPALCLVCALNGPFLYSIRCIFPPFSPPL